MEELRSLVKKRGVIKGKQTLFQNHFENIQRGISNITIENIDKHIILELENRLEKYSQLLTEFDGIQTEIEMLSESPEEQLGERSSFENTYFSLNARCKKIIDEYYTAVNNQNDNESENGSLPSALGSQSGHRNIQGAQMQGLKLPPINLNKFSGDYKNWLEFRDLFDSLIHSNGSLNNVQKFHYLRASLEGGAAQVIRGVETTNSSYQIAWDMLCARYNNKGVLVQNHIKSLMNTPNLTSESSFELQKMVDSVSKHIQSLKTLNQPTESWDTLLIFILSAKLDKKKLSVSGKKER